MAGKMTSASSMNKMLKLNQGVDRAKQRGITRKAGYNQSYRAKQNNFKWKLRDPSGREYIIETF